MYCIYLIWWKWIKMKNWKWNKYHFFWSKGFSVKIRCRNLINSLKNGIEREFSFPDIFIWLIASRTTFSMVFNNYDILGILQTICYINWSLAKLSVGNLLQETLYVSLIRSYENKFFTVNNFNFLLQFYLFRKTNNTIISSVDLIRYTNVKFNIYICDFTP